MFRSDTRSYGRTEREGNRVSQRGVIGRPREGRRRPAAPRRVSACLCHGVWTVHVAQRAMAVIGRIIVGETGWCRCRRRDDVVERSLLTLTAVAFAATCMMALAQALDGQPLLPLRTVTEKNQKCCVNATLSLLVNRKRHEKRLKLSYASHYYETT